MTRRAITTAPKGRRAFFVGDLVDRGPNSPDVLRIVMDMAERGQAFSRHRQSRRQVPALAEGPQRQD